MSWQREEVSPTSNAYGVVRPIAWKYGTIRTGAALPEGHETRTSDGLSRKADALIEQGVVKLPEWHGMASAVLPDGMECARATIFRRSYGQVTWRCAVVKPRSRPDWRGAQMWSSSCLKYGVIWPVRCPRGMKCAQATTFRRSYGPVTWRCAVVKPRSRPD